MENLDVMVLRTLHGWMAAGIAEKAFADAYAALTGES